MTKFLFLNLMALISFNALAHEGHHHANPMHLKMVHPINDTEKKKFELINEKFLSEVYPVFKRTCFDCHSSQTQYPWYYQLPGAKQIIDSDIKEAQGHLVFENGFPFKSHAMPTEDLNAIAAEVNEGDMPPLRYKLLHPKSTLSEDDKKVILNWINWSKETLLKNL